MSGEGVTLTPTEVDGLAMRLVHLLVRFNPEMVAEWEHLPALSESSWSEVAAAIKEYGAKLGRDLRDWERLHDIDTRELLERAS